MKRSIAFLFSFIFHILISAHPAFAEKVLEIIPLNNGNVEEVISVLEPFLDTGGSLSGINGKIIIRTNPENMATLKEILANIDRPLKNLIITVKQGLKSDLDSLETEVHGRIELGNQGVLEANPGPGQRGGLQGFGSAGNSVFGGRIQSGQHRENTMNTQQVRTLDGKPALIQITQSIPIVNRQFQRNYRGRTYTETVEFQSATTGVNVVPRVSGERVTLEIQPQLSRVQPGTIQTQQVVTTVSGRLGEWIEIGGLLQSGSKSRNQLFQSGQVQGQENRSVFVKVQIAH